MRPAPRQSSKSIPRRVFASQISPTLDIASDRNRNRLTGWVLDWPVLTNRPPLPIHFLSLPENGPSFFSEVVHLLIKAKYIKVSCCPPRTVFHSVKYFTKDNIIFSKDNILSITRIKFYVTICNHYIIKKVKRRKKGMNNMCLISTYLSS